MTAEQLEELCTELRSEHRLWTTRELQEYLQTRWKVGYSLRQVRRIARRCGLGYGKPYVLDERRPKDAELQLKRVLRKVANRLASAGILASDVAMGYADESSPQTRCNRVRYWSYRGCRVRDYHQNWRCNTFGFYAIRGKSVVGSLGSSRSGDILEQLTAIREANAGYKRVIVVWDNLSSHKTEEVRDHAKRIGIELVNLPVYSPDLNPIEYLWKGVRRRIAESGIIRSREEMELRIRRAFEECSRIGNYATSWIRNFYEPIFKVSLST